MEIKYDSIVSKLAGANPKRLALLALVPQRQLRPEEVKNVLRQIPHGNIGSYERVIGALVWTRCPEEASVDNFLNAAALCAANDAAMRSWPNPPPLAGYEADMASSRADAIFREVYQDWTPNR